IHQQNKTGQFVFMLAYVAGNVALFAWTLDFWIKSVNSAKDLHFDDPTKVPSSWAPLAKGFGALLDLNCAVILLPVLRTLLRYLYNRSTQDQGLISRFLRGILYFIPLDENLKFHKLVAQVVLISTVIHTLIHFINFAIRPI